MRKWTKEELVEALRALANIVSTAKSVTVYCASADIRVDLDLKKTEEKGCNTAETQVQLMFTLKD